MQYSFKWPKVNSNYIWAVIVEMECKVIDAAQGKNIIPQCETAPSSKLCKPVLTTQHCLLSFLPPKSVKTTIKI